MNLEQRVALNDCIDDVIKNMTGNAKAIERLVFQANENIPTHKTEDDTEIAMFHILDLIAKNLEASSEKLIEMRRSI